MDQTLSYMKECYPTVKACEDAILDCEERHLQLSTQEQRQANQLQIWNLKRLRDSLAENQRWFLSGESYPHRELIQKIGGKWIPNRWDGIGGGWIVRAAAKPAERSLQCATIAKLRELGVKVEES